MENIFTHIGIAIFTFALTNVDDLLLLSFYFSNPLIKQKNIVTGQYLGIFSLITVSIAGALAGKELDPKWIGLLCLVPIFLGIKELANTFSRKKEEENSMLSEKPAMSVGSIAVITIANGGDNIGVYTPLFVSSAKEAIFLYTFIFFLMVAFWCVLGYYLVKHSYIQQLVAKYSHWLLPFFLIGLGISILIKSEAYKLFNSI